MFGKLVAKIKLRPAQDAEKIARMLQRKLKKYIGKPINKEVEAKICGDIVTAYEKYLKVEIVTNFVPDKIAKRKK